MDGALGQGFILYIGAPRKMDPSKRGALLSEGLLILLAEPQRIIGLYRRTKDYIYGEHLPLKLKTFFLKPETLKIVYGYL